MYVKCITFLYNFFDPKLNFDKTKVTNFLGDTTIDSVFQQILENLE